MLTLAWEKTEESSVSFYSRVKGQETNNMDSIGKMTETGPYARK